MASTPQAPITTYDHGMSIEELFPDNTIEEHVLETDMWAGSHKATDSAEYLASIHGIIEPTQTTIVYPPSLYKCIDEAIVNAEDNFIRNMGTARDNPVTHIDISFSRDGRISVLNDGRGVPIGFHSVAKMWSVELIFSVMFKGRAKTDRESKVTGDANRVGIKLANILSSEFTVETVFADDSGARQKYFQRWTNNKKNREEPVISATSESQYTRVTFVPDYVKTFKMTLDDMTYEQLHKLFCFRAYMAASYVGYYSGGKCRVSYQGHKLAVTNMTDLATIMFTNRDTSDTEETDDEDVPVEVDTPTTTTRSKPARKTKAKTSTISINDGKTPIFTTRCYDGTHNWEICVVVATNNASNKKQLACVSNVNGVCVKQGKHINHILDQIIEGVRDDIMKKLKTADIKFQPAFVYNNVFILINAQIPGVGWTGQRKDEAVCETKKIAAVVLDNAFIKRIAGSLEEKVLASVCTTNIIGTVDPKHSDMTKYKAAKLIRKKPHECFLLLPEGDSAASTISIGITATNPKTKKPYLGYDHYGYLTLGGVIMNARKEITVNMVNGKRVITIGRRLMQNKFFNTIIEVLGLNFNYAYDRSSSTYQKEIAGLKYGAVIACVDQDHDGTGFIYPLIVNLFEVFWPKLLEQGFVRKWETPRRRAISRSGQVTEFYSDNDFKQWQLADSKHTTSFYNIDYIKGLAGHEPEYIEHMFKMFSANVITFLPDGGTPDSLEIMFGKDASRRKHWLRSPPIIPSVVEFATRRREQKATFTSLIHNEGKEHALSNLQQKLWSAIDGMNESGRKILDGSIKAFAHDLRKMKLPVLQGIIMTKEHYQHGEASLINSIKGKALLCVGGIQLPQLLPCGQFGTRRLGGDGDSGQPRYIYTTLNKKLVELLYNRDDYPNYSFVDEDGERAEPHYFVPILPMAILEHTHIPAHGWKIQVWARDVFKVISVIRYLINAYTSDESIETIPIPEIEPDRRGFKGEFREIRGVMHCFGDYIFDPDTRHLTITEIPIGSFTESFTRSLDALSTYNVKLPDGSTHSIVMFADMPVDRSGRDYVTIEVTIAPVDKKTGIDPIAIIENHADGCYADGFEEYFGLHTHMHSSLNMIAADRSVITFKNYEDIIRYWFPIRKHFYKLRYQRQAILIQLKKELLENIQRYIDAGIKLNNIDDDIATQILTDNHYTKFVESYLSGIKSGLYIPTDQLENEIKHSDNASHDYLLNVTDRDRLAKASASRKAKIASLQSELDQLHKRNNSGRFIGSDVMLEELDAIEQVIIEGFKTNWLFDKKITFE